MSIFWAREALRRAALRRSAIRNGLAVVTGAIKMGKSGEVELELELELEVEVEVRRYLSLYLVYHTF